MNQSSKPLGFQFFQSREEAEQMFDKLKKAAAWNVRVYIVHNNKQDLNNLKADLYRILLATLEKKGLRVLFNKDNISIYDKMTPINIINFTSNSPNKLRGLDKEQIVEV